MLSWRILVEGTWRQVDTLTKGPQAVSHPAHKGVTHEATPVAMAIVIEAPDCQAAAKEGLDLWWERFPDSRVVMFLIWEVKKSNLGG
jgi:hypothetical protein